MILQLKRFAKSIMMRGDAYLDDEHCVLLGKMFLEQVLYQIPVGNSLSKLSNALNRIYDT